MSVKSAVAGQRVKDRLKTLGDHMKSLRVAKEWSEKFVAEILEINVRRYRDYESGKSAMPVLVFVDICKLYDVPADGWGL